MPHPHLITAPNFENGDDFYEALIATHQGLDTAQSHALNARLVLLLANHVGAQAVLAEALRLARAGAEAPGGEATATPAHEAVTPVAPTHACA